MPDSRDLDVSQLSLAELRELASRLDNEIHERREQGRRWLREHGIVEKGGPLYRNPQNSAESWNGRGRRPEWLERALREGHSLETLRADAPPDPDLPAKARRSVR